ncbi:hypothetical protein S7335_1291 [Synechococcus sp. PCC 7335]|uniref:hypothetical protein n=1 Tax=Synechococcus sp. (strain ATCC 29403 / PCC 7335) TaxID=91464 RepID=UPI00017EB936|nr:hypothetical protein [Synechococcus sp. PCC 7335]EDX82587.1 hypothetical protein S7335_1291 [Synechococcus sp. PCC 7335]
MIDNPVPNAASVAHIGAIGTVGLMSFVFLANDVKQNLSAKCLYVGSSLIIFAAFFLSDYAVWLKCTATAVLVFYVWFLIAKFFRGDDGMFSNKGRYLFALSFIINLFGVLTMGS